MFKLLVLGGLVLAAVVAYKLWKAKKVVTAGTVAAGVEAEVKSAVASVESSVASDVAKKL